MKQFFNEYRNIKWVITLTLCVIMTAEAIDIVLTGDPEIKKFLLIEVFAVLSVLVGYYWGSSKDSESNSESNSEK